MGRKRIVGGVVKTTISIPADLRERMDKIEQRVNWSAVAAEAFKKKVSEMKLELGTIVRPGTHW